MKTSWNQIRSIDNFLLGRLMSGEKEKFEKRLNNDPMFRDDVNLQRQIHFVIRLFQRRRIRHQLDIIHEGLFNNPAKAKYAHEIKKLFN